MLVSQLQFPCRWLLTGGTVIPVSLTAVVPTVLEKFVFQYVRLYLSVVSVSLAWATDTVCTLLFTNNWSFHACKSDSDPVRYLSF